MSRPSKLKFLGFGFFKKWEARPHTESVKKFQRKLKRLTKRNWSISLNVRIKKLVQLIKGWVNYFNIGHIKIVLTRIDDKLVLHSDYYLETMENPKEIDIIVSKTGHWVGRSQRFNILSQRFIGHSKVVQRALSNSRLKQREIPSALEYYLTVTL